MNFLAGKIKNTVSRYYLFSFLKDFGFFSAVLVPFFTQWGHISLVQVQILQSWFVLWVFFLEIPTGVVADRFGRKYSLALGAFIIAVAALIYGSLPKFEIFLLGEFLFAIGVALISGADQALLYDALKEEKRENESQKIFGQAHSLNLLGMLISAVLGGFIASRFGLNAPLLLSAIPFLLACLVAWTIKEPAFHQHTSESKRYLDIAKKGFSYLCRHKTLRLLAIDAIVVSSAAYFVIWLYQPLLLSVNIPIFYFGFVHALLLGTEMLISRNFVFLEKLFGSGKKLLKFSAIITAFTFLLTAAFPSIVTILLFIILAGGFGLTRLELMSAYMNKFIPSEQRATVISSISTFRRLALVLLNPFIGFTADYSLRLALLTVGLLPLLVFLFSPLKQEMLDKPSGIIEK